MLTLSQKMEVSCTVNKFIKVANQALGLKLAQPTITYKLKNSTEVAETTGHGTINFNAGLVNIKPANIIHEVAHLVNYKLNYEDHNIHSETFKNILICLKTHKVEKMTDVNENVEVTAETTVDAKPETKPKKVVNVKTKAKTAKKVETKAPTKIEQAFALYLQIKGKNPEASRQDIIKAFINGLTTKDGSELTAHQAAGYYQNCKRKEAKS